MSKNHNFNIARSDMIEQSVIKLMAVKGLSRQDAEAAMAIAQEVEGVEQTIAKLYSCALEIVSDL